MTSSANRQSETLVAATLLVEVVLMAVTWPLWFEVGPFPAVPLLSNLARTPIIADRILVGLLCLSCVGYLTVFLRQRLKCRSATVELAQTSVARWALVFFFAASALLILLNQHRLQPWHWLSILIVLQALLLDDSQRIFTLRITFAGIYFFSAASRFGPDIGEGMTPQILGVFCRAAGLTRLLNNPTFVYLGCVMMTLTELFTGVALLLPRYRRAAVRMAVLLHLFLLVGLGPLGLNHHGGVLIWNIYFAVATPVLFWSTSTTAPQQPASLCRRSRTVAAVLILCPASGVSGIADNWPAWQLYSARPDIVRILVHQTSQNRLPESLKPFVSPPVPLQDWCHVRIDRWSLATTGAPVYPEDRFQLAIALRLLEATAVEKTQATLRISLETAASPAWWNRSIVNFEDQSSVVDYGDRFLLNAHACRVPQERK